MALEGPPCAPGDFQESLLGSKESIELTRAVPILTMAEGDRQVIEVHSCHDCTSLSVGNVIRQCYFVLLPFHERHKVDA